jgi:hypothetical protein
VWQEAPVASATPWPTSPVSQQLGERQSMRARMAGQLLLRAHGARQLNAGWRGAAAVASLMYVTMRVGLAALM